MSCFISSCIYQLTPFSLLPQKDCKTYSHGKKSIRLFPNTKDVVDDDICEITEENAQNVPWLQARIFQLQVLLARQSEELENARRIESEHKKRLSEMSGELDDLKSW